MLHNDHVGNISFFSQNLLTEMEMLLGPGGFCEKDRVKKQQIEENEMQKVGSR